MSADTRRLIQKQLKEDTQMAGMLAAYNGEPAIFYQKAISIRSTSPSPIFCLKDKGYLIKS